MEPVGGNPCNRCDICKGILDGSIIDVIEIDAASNNGVDDVRQIREAAMYVPAVTRFKVYIIDEVHMLSAGAFNALLKTLEEPPQSVIFILATTESHKLPATILSRCQRFDFKRITLAGIISRLETIAKAVEVDYEPSAFTMIARLARAGSGMPSVFWTSAYTVLIKSEDAVIGFRGWQLEMIDAQKPWPTDVQGALALIDERRQPERILRPLRSACWMVSQPDAVPNWRGCVKASRCG